MNALDCKTALLTLLDQVDYTNGACSPTEMVGAVLPKEVIELCRGAIENSPDYKSALQEAVEWLDQAPFDYSNDVTDSTGMTDEGNVRGWNAHGKMVEKFKILLGEKL